MKTLAGDSLNELSSDAGIMRLRPKVGFVAESEAEVSWVVQEGIRRGLPLTPRGSGTSIPSQAVGTGIVLLQDRRRALMSQDGSVSCEPGLVKAELNRQLDTSARWMPVDPSSYKSCTVGGMVSNNSSGIRTPKYGSTINHVNEIRMVFPEGGPITMRPLSIEAALSADGRTKRIASLILDNQKDIQNETPKVTKNSSGYRLEKVVHDGLFDLPKLFVGSEGTLGVITLVTFFTSNRPSSRVLFISETELDELGALVSAYRELSPTAVELLDKSAFKKMGRWESVAKYSKSEAEYLIFCEFDGSEGETADKVQGVAESKAGGYDPMVLSGGSDITAAWELRNEILSLAMQIRSGNRMLLPGVEDLVAPPERLPDLARLLKDQFESRGLSYISYGHAADANLHARPLLDPDSDKERRMLDDIMEESFEAVWKMGGSMTGEHGDGMLRAGFLSRQYPKTFHLMREIKEIYDPKFMMNPGVKIA